MRGGSVQARIAGALRFSLCPDMKKGDVTCPDCAAGYRRIELDSGKGQAGYYKCLVCDRVLEVFDGSREVAYRLTVQPSNLHPERRH